MQLLGVCITIMAFPRRVRHDEEDIRIQLVRHSSEQLYVRKAEELPILIVAGLIVAGAFLRLLLLRYGIRRFDILQAQ